MFFNHSHHHQELKVKKDKEPLITNRFVSLSLSNRVNTKHKEFFVYYFEKSIMHFHFDKN